MTWRVLLAGLVGLSGAGGIGLEGAASAGPPSNPAQSAAATLAVPMGGDQETRQALDPTATYWVYVGSESADYLHRIRFGPDGARVEADISMAALYRQSGVPELFTEHEAPHGVASDSRSGAVFMTTGHGLPDGKLWKLEGGTGRLLADPVDLGRFPASLGVSPDGNWVYVANFNLHGRMVPSSISVIYAPEMMELARVETCTMPHGSRVHPSGRFHYSTCMMDDQLVEIDGTELEVSRRFFLGVGEEGPTDPSDMGFHTDGGEGHDHPPEVDADPDHAHHGADHAHHDRAADDPAHPVPESPHYEASCSPTWVQPSHDGERIYVACNASDQVLELDHDSWALMRRFDTGRGPYNVDVTADDRLLVITLKQGDGVEFVDLESGELRARLETSTRVVHGVALSPDSRYAFISVEGIGAEPGKVDIFDLSTFERVESVPVGQQASGIAFWKMEGG
jgi:DNA-binding beta-propeller fold protein YncE